MRIPRWVLWGVGLGLIGGAYVLYAVHRENQLLQTEVKKLEHLLDERPVELATFMASYERFLTKLHAAGQAQNWALAAFYYEELEETAEQLEKLDLTDDGVPVSRMMRPNLLEPLELVEKAIQAQDKRAFQESLRSLVGHCNSCHIAAGKPYIQFTLPAEGAPPRQRFEP
ncbi:MAG: hypothetical protein D6750_02495 [Bacteroidetes bacterium]|nr:MAG: hypothetical protein D6750_02495 [Bacteroidota bacterium]